MACEKMSARYAMDRPRICICIQIEKREEEEKNNGEENKTKIYEKYF